MPEASPALSSAQKKQHRILEVATQLFLERGYDAVSLDDILEQVGGSKTTLYSYYGGKEGLFAAIVHDSCQRKLGPLMSLHLTNLDPRTGLTAIGHRFVSLISDPTGQALYRMMIAEGARFPNLAAEFYATGPESTIRLVKRNLDHWQKAGLLRSGDSETRAVQFLGILLGNFSTRVMLGLPVGLSEQDIKDWVDAGVTLFLEGTAVVKTA
jgi:AcrR family transcriptional regulator